MKLNRQTSRKNRRTSAQRLSSRASSRRGVLLLVVLGMLTLFLLIGTAFIVSSNQYRRSEGSQSKFSTQENLRIAQEGFLGEVINQLIRDTNNQNSSLRFHSLLRDLYGTEGLVATVVDADWAKALATDTPTAANNLTGGQFIEVTLANARDFVGNPVTPSAIDNYYNGLVVTFTAPGTQASLEGKSTRIVGYIATEGRFRLLAVPLENGQPLTSLADLSALAGSRILINGRPFNGTGVGYNAIATPGMAKLDAYENVTNVPNGKALTALMPNGQFFDANQAFVSARDATGDPMGTAQSYYGPGTFTPVQQGLIQRVVGFDGLGGSDESYDAPDFQNMFLAWTGPNVVDTIFTSFDGTPNSTGTSWDRTNVPPFLGNIVVPSFHRPDLINYWANQTPGLGLTGGVPLLRKIMLRPNWHDHPNFTGSNPEYAAATIGSDKLLRTIYGPWDVDNDNDGVRDSVWVDFGAPVMMDKHGRMVKPLAAIMVLDMDGRLNVNAHATRELQNPTDFNIRFAGGADSDRVPKGQGFGVAEITLGPVLNRNPFGGENARYGEILNGATVRGVFYPGRYGTDREPGNDNRYDLSGQMKMQGLPAYVPGTASLYRSNYGTLPDLRARYSMGLNQFGQSILEWNYLDFVDNNGNGVFDYGVDEARLDEDNPYEFDLSTTGPRGTGTAVDSPYSLAELERVLRLYDVDAGTLPRRLHQLLVGNRPEVFDPSDPDYDQRVAQFEQDQRNYRSLLTTDSFDLPEPNFQMPAWVRLGIDGVLDPDTEQFPDDYVRVMGKEPTNGSYADLVEYRFRLAQVPTPWYKSEDTRSRLEALRIQLHRVIAPEMLAGLKLDLNRPFGNGLDDNNNGVVDEPGEFFDANGDGLAGWDEIKACWTFDSTRLSANEQGAAARRLFEDDGFTDTDGDSATNYGIYRDDHDRNGDGVIDPVERGYTETVGGQTPQQRSDANSPLTHAELINLHNYRRQLLARQLYMLALSLVDPLPPLDLSIYTLPQDEKIRKEKIKLHRETLAEQRRSLAQWAINVVDFRDPDNIMTPFEYDANPFNGWQVDEDIRTTTDLPNFSDNGVNDTTPTPNDLVDREDPEELPFRNGIDDDGDGLIDEHDPDEIAERQVVWGMERPELVMTETLAWHDRATIDGDENTEDAVTDEPLYRDSPLRNDKIDEKDMGQVAIGGGQTPGDTDYDQQAKPRGAAFIELYNPWGPAAGAANDTHLIDPANGNDLGVDLAAVSIPTTIPNGENRTSPVWRIDVRKTVDYKSNAGTPRLGRYVGGPDHDPDDPDQRVNPQIPDRSIYFTPFDPEERFEMRRTTEVPGWESMWDDDGVAFFSSLTDPTAPVDGTDPSYIRNHAVVRPGRYMVVGSGIPVNEQGDPVEPTLNPSPLPNAVPARNPAIARYETWVGDKKRTSEVKRHAILLNPFATGGQTSVMVRNSTPDPVANQPNNPDLPLRDQAGFDVSAPADMTSVAIIDSTWFRNVDRTTSPPQVRNGGQDQGWEYRPFSVSEPATGYPLATFNSYWTGKYYSDPNGRYSPALDIPLDNQRWYKHSYPPPYGNVVDGQTVIGVSGQQIRWMRKARASDKTATFELQKDNELRLTLPEKQETSVRTIPAFSWLYLQRLANPLIPWNPLPGHPKHRPSEVVNPYMTVDSMGVNVTIFNGQENTEKRVQMASSSAMDIRDYGNSYAIRSFASLQRGRANVDDVEQLRGRIRDVQGEVGEPASSDGVPIKVTPDTGFRNLGNDLAFPKNPALPARFTFGNFVRDPHEGNDGTGKPVTPELTINNEKVKIENNLWGEELVGYVDKDREDMVPALKFPIGVWGNRSGPNGDGLYRQAVTGSHYFHTIPDCTLGFLNEPFRPLDPARSEFDKKFVPTQPFPWITWNNRPYANPGEILQVPHFRSSQVLKVFGMSKGYTLSDDVKGYFFEKYRGYIRRGTYPVPLDFVDEFRKDPGRIDFNVAYPPIAADGPFGHLPNYLRSLMNHDRLSLTVSDYQPDPATMPPPYKKKLNPKPYYQGNAGLHRVLDLVTVSSLYVGGETWLSPVAFGTDLASVDGSSNPVLKDAHDPRYGFQPPFNKVSSRREPGKININTIAAEAVWNAIFHGDAQLNPGRDTHPGPQDNDLAASRRGYGVKPVDSGNDPEFNTLRELWKDPTLLNANYPTVFANPFRHGDAGYLVPLNNMVLQGVDCTLERRDAPIKGNDGEWGTAGVDDGNGIDDDNQNGVDDPGEMGIDPIMNGLVDDLIEQGFGVDATMPPARKLADTKVPFNGATTVANTDNNFTTFEQPQNLFRDASRNPYFRYSPVSRLSSMTTTRSNVFAVWVTIGFFEVEEITDDPSFDQIVERYGTDLATARANPLFHRVYPDGYLIGKEAGIDTGETVRYREFAIIDRTIPVGFEPGANHNARETIRLQRTIE